MTLPSGPTSYCSSGTATPSIVPICLYEAGAADRPEFADHRSGLGITSILIDPDAVSRSRSPSRPPEWRLLL